MNLHELFTDDQAVSQVVGVILMVAITVLLAATAASFFLGITESDQTTAPQVAITFDFESTDEPRDALEITHESGTTVDATELDVAIQDAATPTTVVDRRFTWKELSRGSPDEVAAGMSATVNRSSIDPSGSYSKLSLKGASVRVVWGQPSGTRTFVLAKWQGPDR
jgi:flagellin-like protein